MFCIEWDGCAEISLFMAQSTNFLCQLFQHSMTALSSSSAHYSVWLDVARQFITGAMSWHFPPRNGSFIWTTLMAAAVVKTIEPIHSWGASYCDSQSPNCSFEVITRQVRAISSTMPETNGGGRAHLMRSESWGRPPEAPERPSSLILWELSASL